MNNWTWISEWAWAVWVTPIVAGIAGAIYYTIRGE